MKRAGSENMSVRTMDISITITRKKIKNMYLRVHPDGTVTVSAPKRVSDKVIRDFVNSKTDWILTQLQKVEERKKAERKNKIKQAENPAYLTGEIHYYWGCPCKLLVEETTGKSHVEFVENPHFGDTMPLGNPEQNDNTIFGILYIHAPKNSTTEQRKHLLDEFYRRKLKLVVPDLIEKYVAIVGKAPVEWRIRDMKTRWGTCNTKDKRIWLSLHLAKKHPDCLEYVIAHELTHLHVSNHSKEFWTRMDVYYPEWKEVRKLLNER
ncbi:MAG: M48 family metallopeptidase [Lachnospiraceae bacterium]|nr:M48 family metallopeptidase [Lachnospiraceae bacterium]MBP3576573.1 M48 family metallopeptidase [Lachnospiraceae bacterium]